MTFIAGLVISIALVIYFTIHLLRVEEGSAVKAKREAQKREKEAEYHADLSRKYAATMTEADRKWYASLPDWDRLPIFRSDR